MQSKDIKDVIKENMRYTRMLEEYDKKREFPLDKTRKNFTIKKGNYWKLKSTSKKTGKSMSEIIDEVIEKI